MQCSGSMHLGSVCCTEVDCSLVGEGGVRELVCRVEDAAEAHPIAVQGTQREVNCCLTGDVAAYPSHYLGSATSNPRPVALAALHHAIAARRKDKLSRAVLDE